MRTSRTNQQTAQVFHSRAMKKMTTNKKYHFHFEESSQYRNPIVGIEAALEEKLQENEKLFRGSIVKKKNLLIDALEDLSQTQYGFGKQIQYSISFWRPQISENLDLKLKATKNDIEKIQKQIDDLQTTDYEFDNIINDLTDRIDNVKNEIIEYQQKNKEMKSNLFLNSDRFFDFRVLSESISQLQDQYTNMFVRPVKSKYFPENKEFADENELQKKKLAKLHYEVEISNQVSKKLKKLNKENKQNSTQDDD